MKQIAFSVLSLSLAAALCGSASAQNYGPGYAGGNRDDGSLRSDVARVTHVERLAGNGRYDGRGDYDWRGQPYQRQECWNERTNSAETGYYRDQNGRLYKGDANTKSSRAVIGAIIGGVLGNQVGDGRGQTAATIAGAAIGAGVGSNTGDRNRYDGRDNRFEGYDRYTDNSGTELRCRMVTEYADNRGRGNGRETFRVSYLYAGQTYEAITNVPPGRTMRVLVDVRPEIGEIDRRR